MLEIVQDVLAGATVRELAREVLEGHRCVAAARRAMSAALLPLLNALRQHAAAPPQQEPRRRRGEASAALTRRAAALVAAARPHAAAAQGQVRTAMSTPSKYLQHVASGVRLLGRELFLT